MNEAQYQGLVTKWMKKNAWGSFPYELKVTKNDKLYFTKFEPQQLPALQKANKGVMHYKLTDASLGIKPYDAQVYKKSLAYIGILFNKDTSDRESWFIDIALVNLFRKTGRKFIYKQFCQKYGIEVNIANITGILK